MGRIFLHSLEALHFSSSSTSPLLESEARLTILPTPVSRRKVSVVFSSLKSIRTQGAFGCLHPLSPSLPFFVAVVFWPVAALPKGTLRSDALQGRKGDTNSLGPRLAPNSGAEQKPSTGVWFCTFYYLNRAARNLPYRPPNITVQTPPCAIALLAPGML